MGVMFQLNCGNHPLDYTVSKYKDTECVIHHTERFAVAFK